MSDDNESARLPADLESAVRSLNPECEARYVRPETRDQPRRYAICCNPADYVVTLVNACGHSISEPMCATHHDSIQSYWNAGRMVVACERCGVKDEPAEMRCEPL